MLSKPSSTLIALQINFSRNLRANNQSLVKNFLNSVSEALLSIFGKSPTIKGSREVFE
ncbi:hypothetical protein [Mycoplasmopsis alligatoris]|uniref:hypothetical protein n=1 Tax=Mycoplasmopsis alligatoris TaxID=47687 RepID=UPI0012EA99EA|nr:hypothetical protein [Mycoplasmopsis alligatoris]